MYVATRQRDERTKKGFPLFSLSRPPPFDSSGTFLISRLMRITRHVLDKAFNFFSLARLLPPQERRINKKSRLDFSTHEYHIARNGLCTLQTASTPFSKLNYLSPSTVSPICFSLSLSLCPRLRSSSPFSSFSLMFFTLSF